MALQYIPLNDPNETFASAFTKSNQFFGYVVTSSTYNGESLYFNTFDPVHNFVITGFSQTILSGVSQSQIIAALGFTPISSVTYSAVTSALGYIPYNGGLNPNNFVSLASGDTRYYLNTNPRNYLTGITSAQIIAALGFTPSSGSTGGLGSNQLITLGGDVQGSGTTAITVTLNTVTSANIVGSNTQIPIIQYDAKGRILSAFTVTVATAGSSGITAINDQVNMLQILVTGNTGIDFQITSTAGVHTFNIPTIYSGATRGLLSLSDWNTFMGKISDITSLMVISALGYFPLSSVTYSAVTSALGYIPYNGELNPNNFVSLSSGDSRYYQTTNPKGYISGISQSQIQTALGFNPLSGITLTGDIYGSGNTLVYNQLVSVTTPTIIGSSTMIPIIQIDAKGRVISSSTIMVASSASSGITSVNGQTNMAQTLITANTGTDFQIFSISGIHTFSIPTIGTGSTRGLLSNADWTRFNNIINDSATTSNQQTWSIDAIKNYINTNPDFSISRGIVSATTVINWSAFDIQALTLNQNLTVSAITNNSLGKIILEVSGNYNLSFAPSANINIVGVQSTGQTNYLTINCVNTSANTFIGEWFNQYFTGVTSSQIQSALGYTPISGITLVGDVIGSGSTILYTHLASIHTGGTVGSSTQIPIITYDESGRIISATTVQVVTSSGGTESSGFKTYSSTTYSSGNVVSINAQLTNVNISAVTGNQTVSYAGLSDGLYTKFIVDKQTANNIAITLPNNSLIIPNTLDVSYTGTVVTLSGTLGSKYIFETKNEFGFLLTNINKIASDFAFSSPKVIGATNSQRQASAVTATTGVDIIVAQVPIPAGTVGANSTIRITILATGPGDSQNKTFKVWIGSLGASTGLLSSNFFNSGSLVSMQKMIHLHCNNSLNAQKLYAQTGSVGFGTSSALTTYAADFSVDQVLNFGINYGAASGGSSAYEGIIVEIIN
jgi:hypothetical protein